MHPAFSARGALLCAQLEGSGGQAIGQQQGRGHIHGGKDDHADAEGHRCPVDVGVDHVADKIGQARDQPIAEAGVLQPGGHRV